MDTGNAVSEPERAIVSSNDEPTDVQLDIRKYEGHTPGPWRCVQDDYGTSVVVDTTVIAHVHFDEDKDALLIADAPLLLEEVKCLRNKIRLLDIVEDRDGALDKTLLNSGMLTEKELKGAYSDSELVGVEFLN